MIWLAGDDAHSCDITSLENAKAWDGVAQRTRVVGSGACTAAVTDAPCCCESTVNGKHALSDSGARRIAFTGRRCVSGAEEEADGGNRDKLAKGYGSQDAVDLKIRDLQAGRQRVR